MKTDSQSAKPTKLGSLTITEHNWSDTSIYKGEKLIARLSIADTATERTQAKLEKEMDAYARLFAAAPDLLEALKPFAVLLNPDGLSQIGGGTSIAPSITVQMVKDAQAAIAKAAPV